MPQSITWGFPLRLASIKPASKAKPVNNIADLLKPMWRGLAARPRWRCPIPLTAFAEAEGQKGALDDDAVDLQRPCFPASMIEVERTPEPWAKTGLALLARND